MSVIGYCVSIWRKQEWLVLRIKLPCVLIPGQGIGVFSQECWIIGDCETIRSEKPILSCLLYLQVGSVLLPRLCFRMVTEVLGALADRRTVRRQEVLSRSSKMVRILTPCHCIRMVSKISGIIRNGKAIRRIQVILLRACIIMLQAIPVVVNGFLGWFFIIKRLQLLACLILRFRSYVQDIVHLFLARDSRVNEVISRQQSEA